MFTSYWKKNSFLCHFVLFFIDNRRIKFKRNKKQKVANSAVFCTEWGRIKGDIYFVYVFEKLTWCWNHFRSLLFQTSAFFPFSWKHQKSSHHVRHVLIFVRHALILYDIWATFLYCCRNKCSIKIKFKQDHVWYHCIVIHGRRKELLL